MIRTLDHNALLRIASAYPRLQRKAEKLRKFAQAEEVPQGLDWRDLQDISKEISGAVQQQDLRRLMEAVEDMTSLMLSHIQLPADTDVSGAFPREEAYVENEHEHDMRID